VSSSSRYGGQAVSSHCPSRGSPLSNAQGSTLATTKHSATKADTANANATRRTTAGDVQSTGGSR
jgi:hypothetical protein